MGSNDTKTTTMKHHVFLFRHCVRSTDSNVYLFNNTMDTTQNNISQSISSFWSRLSQSEVVLPNWNVPKNWCTEQGMKQMYETGMYIYNTLLVRPSPTHQQPNRKLKFRFISDTSQRDVDTTLSLQEGISAAILADTVHTDLYMEKENGTMISLASTNVHATEYIPNLFQPFIGTTMSTSPMCMLQITPERMKDEVQDRYDHQVPQPSVSIYDTLKVLQVNDLIQMNANEINNVTVTMDAWDRPQLSGMINVLKLVAQMIFYSRASGIRPRQFLYRITTQQLYTILLPYIYYTRSILNVGTTESATRGAILTRTMMDAMLLPSVGDTIANEEEHVDMVTILVGHDTDLDAVATAMNAAWEFDVPYSTNNTNEFLAWYMTPPGSAIYLSHESTNDETTDTTTRINIDSMVHMTYLLPIYDVDANRGSIQSYDMVPLQLLNYTSSRSSSTTPSSYTIHANSTTIAYKELQYRINQTLQQYIGATDCYYNPVPVSGLDQAQSEPDSESDQQQDLPSNPNAPVSTERAPTTTPATKSISSIGPSTTTSNGGYMTTPSFDGSRSSSTNNIAEQSNKQLSWLSGFGSGIAAAVVLAVFFWFYNYRKQRRLRSHYIHPQSMASSLQLEEYGDVTDADDATITTRNTSKRNINLI